MLFYIFIFFNFWLKRIVNENLMFNNFERDGGGGIVLCSYLFKKLSKKLKVGFLGTNVVTYKNAQSTL